AAAANQRFWDLLHSTRAEMSWQEEFPLSSPYVWRFVVDFYRKRPKPIVFEYGLGVSTLHHIRNLLECSGSYEGVDHNPGWYSRAVREILLYCIRHEFDFRSETQTQKLGQGPHAIVCVDTRF